MKILKVSDDQFIDQMVECQLKMAKESENLVLDKEVLTKGMHSVMDDPSKGSYYLAIEGDQLQGMLLTISEWSDWRCREVLWIHSVYVLPEYRGKGVYSSLYQYLKDFVESHDHFAGLRLYVDKNNSNASLVYEKLGMSNEHYDLYEWLK